MNWFVNKIIRPIKSAYLCLRYPFLYPRNRWTDLHYSNWAIIEKCKKLYSEAYMMGNKENHFKPILISKRKAVEYCILKWFHDVFLQYIFCIPKYTELDALEDGWRKAFGLQICQEIKESLLRSGGKKLLKEYRITQIKEKYGHLEWYSNWYTKEITKIIQKYEYISFRTCINCGRPAYGYTGGYIRPYCEDCSDEYDKAHMHIFGSSEDNTWYEYFSTSFKEEPDQEN